MIVSNVSDFTKDMQTYLDKVSNNFEPLIVNHGKNENVVILSLEAYNSLIATNHELSSRKNEMRLNSAIRKLRAKQSFEKDLIEA
jgi:antitoxin YefM